MVNKIEKYSTRVYQENFIESRQRI